jgi:hypothetical protein
MKAGWIINKDYGWGEDKKGFPIKIMGPCGVTLTEKEIIEKGTHFKMYDGDGNLWFSGYVVGDEFAPLDNYGKPAYGCTHMKIRNKDGKYEDL